MERITIAQLDIDTEALVKDAAQVSGRIQELKNSQKELKNENKQGTEEYVKQAAEIKRLNAIQRSQQRGIIALTNAEGELVEVEQRINDLTSQNITTNKEATENTRELMRIRDLLNSETEEGAAAIEEINNKIDENNEFLDENSDKVTKNRRNVGDYKNSVKDAVSELGIFPGVAGKATQATKAFNTTLLANPITIVVAALVALFKAFQSTQEGADKLNAILQPLKAIFDVFIGSVQQLSLLLADKLTAAFKNPEEALKSFGNLLKTQIMNRVEGMIGQFGALARVIKSVVTLNFDEAKEAAVDFGNLTLQSLTGVEDVIGKVGAGASRIKESIDVGIEAGNRLADLQIKIEELQIKQAVPLSRLRKEYELLRTQGQNVNIEEEKRLELLDEASAKLAKIAEEETKLLDLQIEQLELKQSLNDTSRQEELELQQLIAQREEIEAQRIATNLRLENQRNTIIKKLRTDEEKATQEAIEATAKKREEEEKAAQDAIQTTIDKRKEQLEAEKEVLAAAREARELEFDLYLEDLRSKGALETEIKLEQAEFEFEERTAQIEEQNMIRQEQLRNQLQAEQITKEEFDRLSTESEISQNQELLRAEAEFARTRIEITQAVADAKLNLFSDLFANLATIFGENSKAGKAAAIAQATIDTFAGASKALASVPFPFNIAAAAATVASGIKNVQTITQQDTGSEFKGVEQAANAADLEKKSRSGDVPKAERGALFPIGGSRHSQGGTDFIGSDGTAFEAEQGEILGVMSRPAAQAFMSFNNLFNRGAMSRPGTFQSGGTPARGTGFNTDELAERIGNVLGDRIAELPNPIVGVQDISEGLTNRAEIVDGASF